MSRFNVFDATVYKKILVKMVKKIKKGNKKRKKRKKTRYIFTACIIAVENLTPFAI